MLKFSTPISALLLWIGCSFLSYTPKYLDQGKPYISRASATDSINISSAQVLHNGMYYVVPGSELSRVGSSRYLTYLGTEKGYHLLRIWTKIPQNEHEIWLFATNMDSCLVQDRNDLNEEFRKYSLSYRRVDFSLGCRVINSENDTIMDSAQVNRRDWGKKGYAQ